MRMVFIVIHGPSNVNLINCVHLGTLKSVDNALYVTKIYPKVFFMRDMVREHQLSITIDTPSV